MILVIITSPDVKFSQHKVYIFKKDFIGKKSGHCTINITAESRYKLFVDNTLVAFGPQRGAEGEIYYDTVCLDDYLKDGKNEIVVEVMQLRNYHDFTINILGAIFRSGMMSLALWGKYEDDDGEIILDTNKDWLVAEKTDISLMSEEKEPYKGADIAFIECEEHVKKTAPYNWINSVEVDDINTERGVFNYGRIYRRNLKKRTISPLNLKMRCVNIHPEKRNLYDAYELTIGFVKVKYSGKGTIKLTYAECFREKTAEGALYKGDRTNVDGDATTNCMFDIIDADGTGEWESFWTRTFRYITVETTGDASVDYIYYIETGYPLNGTVLVDFNNENDNKLWKISMRSLQCCAQETYTDCPYYEQLQYTMDTYLQMLYTYQISHDDLLARNAIHLYRLSQNDEGYVMSRYPSVSKQIIPGFCLFYIMMVYEHYKRFGDEKLVKENIFCIEKILEAFNNDIDENGLVHSSKYWDFVDWASGWIHGIAPVGANGSNGIYTLMYAYVLKQAQYLCNVVGRNGDMYLERADKLLSVVEKLCYCEEKEQYANSQNKEHFSQHMQVWAVLSGLATGDKAKAILEKSFEHQAKSTFAFDHLLLRALELADMYDKRADILQPYYDLIEKHCTTIPETPFAHTRSECHAWGSIVLYEFTAKDLGVTWENNSNCREIRINPYINARKEAKGKVCTSFGDVFVEWKKADKFSLELYTPENVKKVITLPDGNVTETTESYINLECNL